jgi:hypothetical protein
LLHKLGSTHHAKAFISRELKERGLIKRKVGEAATSGQFAPVYNFITARGTELLKKFEHVTSFREQ